MRVKILKTVRGKTELKLTYSAPEADIRYDEKGIPAGLVEIKTKNKRIFLPIHRVSMMIPFEQSENTVSKQTSASSRVRSFREEPGDDPTDS